MFSVTIQGPTGRTITVTVSATSDEKASTAALRQVGGTAAQATRDGWLVLSVTDHNPVL